MPAYSDTHRSTRSAPPVSITDVSDDEYGGEACRRVICREETRRVDVHACREAHWHAVDVAGARPAVVFSVFKRFLSANGFSVRLSWGRPDIRINVFRAPRPLFCELERPQMLEVADLRALGFERPHSEPSMGRWASSPSPHQRGTACKLSGTASRRFA